MLFHPTTLRLLCEWKMCSEESVPLDLLALVIDCRAEIDYNELDSILYGHRKNASGKRARMGRLRAVVEEKFSRAAEDATYLLCDLSAVSRETRRLVEKMRKRLGRGGRKESVEEPAKRSQRTSILNFVRIEDRRERMEPVSLGPFIPISFDGSTVVSSARHPLMSTLRVRRDIQDARRLFFVKFSELRPSVYGFRTERIMARNSLARLPQIHDYDCDEEWEDEEDAETIDSTDEEDDDSGESCQEWIDSDVEQVELTRSNKRPLLSHPACRFAVLSTSCAEWMRLPLLAREVFPEDCLDAFREGLDAAECISDFVRAFGRRHVIRLSAMNRKLRDLGACAVKETREDAVCQE